MTRPALKSVAPLTPFIHNLIKIGPATFRRNVVLCMPSKAIQRFRRVLDVLDATARCVMEGNKRSAASEHELDQKDVLSNICMYDQILTFSKGTDYFVT